MSRVEFTNTWISLEDWGKRNGLESAGPAATNPSFVLRGKEWNMALKMGSRIAQCNGLVCWLGYAPQLIKGLPHIHALDARKNLQPLLAGEHQVWGAKRTIVIDPGHGGRDPGTKSTIENQHEKFYALDWARRLEKLLTARGWRVVLTRTNDSEILLADRVAMAENVRADLFLSLHFNSGISNRDLNGIETYCLTPTGLPSNLLRIDVEDLKQAWPNNSFDDQNLRLAWSIHRSLLAGTDAADRGVRRARFMTVLRGQNRPAVLIEGGYLSHPAEARKISTAPYRQRLAEAVAKALE